MNDELSPEYVAALEASREATRAFSIVRDAYRAGKISDADFLAARDVYDAADAAFDAAWLAEGARNNAKEKAA